MAYSHDGFGLGHVRRNTNIAARFVRDTPGSNALLVVGCSPGAFFRSGAGVDFIKIPSIVKVDTEVWRPRSLQMSEEKIRVIRTRLIQQAADTFRPDIFLVDYTPTGVWGELLPTLSMLKQRKDPPVIVLGIRDILDAPEVTCKAWRQKGAYEVISKYYDEILVYGSQDVFDTAAQYGLDTVVQGKIRYCGYVCTEEPYKTKERMRAQLQLSKDKFIVVTAGGGHDAYPMMMACIEAFQLLGKDLAFEALLITGPLMEPQQQEALQVQAEKLGVRLLTCVEDSLSYISAADLVVTMAGYNSLCEVLHLGKKTLVIPRCGPSAEQQTRAKLLADRRLIDMIDPRDLSPELLAERLREDLERDDYPIFDRAVRLDGAARAAAQLSELVVKPACPEPGVMDPHRSSLKPMLVPYENVA